MEISNETESKVDTTETKRVYKQRIYWWPNVTVFLLLHIGGIYGLYLALFSRIYTILWASILAVAAVQATTIGAHRLFAHRAFKATYSLRLILVMLHTLQGQGSCYTWVRYHRVHHKFSDTDSDPHNSKRGFFYAHVGWLLVDRHPLVSEKMKALDLSDLLEDEILMFQKKYFYQIYFLLNLLIPVSVPMYLWEESFSNSFFVCYVARYMLCTNFAFSINSVAHMFGNKPYDKYIESTQSTLVSIVTGGEGWHNYHHAFPWDYRAAELGSKFNLSRHLIDICAYFNLAYNLRTTSYDMIKAKSIRSGDGSFGEFDQKSN